MNDLTNLLTSIELAPNHESKPSLIATKVPSYKFTEDAALDTLHTVEEKENTTLGNELGLTFPNLAEPGKTEQEESTKWKLKPRKSITNKLIIKQASLTQPSPPPADEPGANFLFGNVHTPIPVQFNREHLHSPPALFRASSNEDTAIPMPFLSLTEMTEGSDVAYRLPRSITLKIRPGMIGRPSLPQAQDDGL